MSAVAVDRSESCSAPLCAAVLLRRSRERLRDELRSISVDVLRETGDSLAQRLEQARRAEEERAAGEMARRAEEIKGLVGPVQEKLGRMEGEIGRLERERRQAQGELAQMVRQLGEGVGTLRQETGNLVTALKRPSTRGSWGEIQLRNVVEMAGMVSHCDFVEQSTIQHRRRRRCGPTCSCAFRAESWSWSTRRSRSTPTSRRSSRPTEAERELHIARHAKQTREHIAKLASKGYQRQFDSTPEFVVMFVPSDGIYQAALAQDPGADRVRRPAAGPDGHADDADRPAVGRPLRLAPGADRRVGARDRRVGARAAPPARALRRAARARSGASSTPPSPPTTRRSAPSTIA